MTVPDNGQPAARAVEPTWWVVVEVPQSKVEVWGEAVFDAVAEAVEGVTDGRKGWDPFVWSAGAAHVLLSAQDNAGLAPSPQPSERAASWSEGFEAGVQHQSATDEWWDDLHGANVLPEPIEPLNPYACSDCSGQGHVGGEPCPSCLGEGTTP